MGFLPEIAASAVATARYGVAVAGIRLGRERHPVERVQRLVQAAIRRPRRLTEREQVTPSVTQPVRQPAGLGKRLLGAVCGLRQARAQPAGALAHLAALVDQPIRAPLPLLDPVDEAAGPIGQAVHAARRPRDPGHEPVRSSGASSGAVPQPRNAAVHPPGAVLQTGCGAGPAVDVARGLLDLVGHLSQLARLVRHAAGPEDRVDTIDPLDPALPVLERLQVVLVGHRAVIRGDDHLERSRPAGAERAAEGLEVGPLT